MDDGTSHYCRELNFRIVCTVDGNVIYSCSFADFIQCESKAAVLSLEAAFREFQVCKM